MVGLGWIARTLSVSLPRKAKPARFLSSTARMASSLAALGEEVQLTVPWGQVSGLAYGPVDGRPVLGVHGWLDNANSFHELAKHLPSNIRFVAIDLPGHGFSSHRPVGASYTFFQWVSDIELITHALGWKHFSLVGHSMGGAISLIYAGTFPEKVGSVCLIEGIVPVQEQEDKACEILRQSIITNATLSTKKQRLEPSLEAAEAKLLSSNPALSREAAHQLLRRGAIACDGGYRFTRDLRVRMPSPFRMSEKMVNSFIANVACEVMLVVADSGLHAAITDRERRQVELLRSSAASLDIVRVPGTHHVHMNDPEIVAPHFVRFLERASSSVRQAKL